MKEGPTYDFEKACTCINESHTLETLSEYWNVFKKERKCYTLVEFKELYARCQLKASILLNQLIEKDDLNH